MMWKAIGSSVTGTSHIAAGRGCEDALLFRTMSDGTLIACASDGAGSASEAAFASAWCVDSIVEMLAGLSQAGTIPGEVEIYTICETIYAQFARFAAEKQLEINEFSCTLAGCYLASNYSLFFHMGDGAIVRRIDDGLYTTVWWPHNGEYQNLTCFLVDDPLLGQLKIQVIDERIDEIALFTDGLQMLALNFENHAVHQPFFTDLFRFLRLADDSSKLEILNRKLIEFLNSDRINTRTDDDKTLFLATRLGNQ